MQGIIKKPYEISLWEDRLVWHRKKLIKVLVNEENYAPGVFYSQNLKASGAIPFTLDYDIYSNDKNYYELDNSDEGIKGWSANDVSISEETHPDWYLNGTIIPNVIFQYFSERKIATIGSDIMQAPVRAVSPKLVSNVNGSNSLTFSLYSHYYDEEDDQFYANPFIKMLVNERKVKLRYGAFGETNTKWYDFVIKNIQEKSDTKTYVYTCKDLFINELSKSGFGLTLDAELENNMGNIEYLAEKVLEESDWRLGTGSSKLEQTIDEPVYRILLNTQISAKNMRDENEAITIKSGEWIYGLYTPINNKEAYFQFLYVPKAADSTDIEAIYELDDDHVITNSKNWFIEGMTYNEETGNPIIAEVMSFSDKYRGARLVRQSKIVFDSTINKYVYVYKDASNKKYYGYTESDYVSPTAVLNYITQPNSFVSTDGWEVGGIKIEGEEATQFPELVPQGYPDVRDLKDYAAMEDTVFQSFLKYKSSYSGQLLFNSGFADSRSKITKLVQGEKYLFRLKYATATENSAGRPEKMHYQSSAPNFKAGIYDLNDGVYTITEELFDTESVSYDDKNHWITYNLICNRSVEYKQLIIEKLGLFLQFQNPGSYYIEEAEFFPYITYQDNEGKTQVALPGGQLISYVKTTYYIYEINENYKSIEDVKFLYEGDKPSEDYIQVYNDGEGRFEKTRSITASESNRFNLIQELCELFECWPRFTIEHEVTGEIALDENYRQKKWVTFHEYIGRDNYAGFKYGINLKSIQRTLDSDGIVSKLVVKDNANEFGKDGFCSIARGDENPSGENFIYDFSYYIQQGLLSHGEVFMDLYSASGGYIGYYAKLREFNNNRDKWIDEQSNLRPDISNHEANHKTYKVSVEESEEELRDVYIQIEKMTGFTYEEMAKISKGENIGKEVTQEDKNWWNRNEFITLVSKIAQLKSRIAQHTKMYEQSESYLKQAQEKYDKLTEQLENLVTQKRALNLQFYKKYSRFIQEGSWINEDYIDDNLYFLDASSTLFTSAQPKVTYTINVLELSQLDGYENYSVSLGDKTYMEDTEFFGWTWKNGVRTPYHEEIVVSEITFELDSPEKNIVKVQNYKTQFEDLFQRITATTQSVEYHTGEYSRASNIVESDGTIGITTLQNSIANNSLVISNARDQSVEINEFGITTTSLARPNEKIRLVSGGLFLSLDGGMTWSTGITGAGINANYITSGQINTDKIFIMNGSFPSFKWDKNGISAYEFRVDSNNKPYGFNTSKFVRFDQYGVYGIKGNEGFIPKDEADVWSNANYALTWKGFMLKNDDGSVRITSTDDIQVLSGDKERIKIGRISKDLYGIRISNANGAAVMETDDQGELWLKNRLRVGTDGTSTVEIGYLDAVRAETDVHEVIHAGDGNQEFIVYEDGKMVAQGAEFRGTIYATGGQIGNMTIGEVEGAVGNMNSIAEATRKLDISSKLGYNFKVERGVSSPIALELLASPTAFTINTDGINWFGSNNFEVWDELASNTNSYVLTYENFKNKQLNSTYYIKAVATATDGTSYEDWTTIMSISDGEKGEDALTLVITSSGGNYFKNNTGETVLTARLFKTGQEIDTVAPYDYTYTWTRTLDDNWSYVGKSLTVTANDVDFSRTYVCNVS